MNWKTKTPLIAILRGIKPHEVNEHISVLINSGFDSIEIPLNSPDWEKSITLAVEQFGDKVLIGAGTVVNSVQVDKLASIGCQLIVTPNINLQVIKQAIKHKMTLCAGCATATEAYNAIDLGASNLKIFPSVIFGPNYIKALKSVLPKDIAIFAVGGITPNNLNEYLKAGCVGAGLGSDLYKQGQTKEETQRKAEAFIDVYKNYNLER